jgi:hypothetical protein
MCYLSRLWMGNGPAQLIRLHFAGFLGLFKPAKVNMSARNVSYQIALLREQARIAIKHSNDLMAESHEIIRTCREMCGLPPMPEPDDTDGE